MKWLAKLINKVLPEDPVPQCGYGPFSLPPDHPFTRACILHDYDFELAHNGQQKKTLDQVDAELFNRWALIAKNAPTVEEQLELMHDICDYWPWARRGGELLWDGKR